MADILIEGGKIVSPYGVDRASLLIKGRKVAGILADVDGVRADKVIDATGKLVLPGLVDPHVHMESHFMGAVSGDDFHTGTVAGAYGGVTTIIDFAYQAKGQSLKEAIDQRRARAEGRVVVDYGLHVAVTDLRPEVLGEVREVIDSGIPSLKVFMIYRREGLMMDDGALLALLQECKEYGGLAGAHAENAAIYEHLEAKHLREGRRSAKYHALSKPSIVEAECINRAIYLANWTGAAFYVFHMSCKEGVRLVGKARRDGHPIYAETCPHYLVLTDEEYERPDGINWIMSPPLRKKEDNDLMWQGLADGRVSVVGTDHSDFDTEAKKLGQDSFEKVPNGAPGIESRLMVLYSEGVRKGRLSLERMVEVCSTNPAKLFGLYPQKGVLAVGSDADIVILDPDVEKTLGVDTLHMVVDWCPLEGIKVRGWPVVTISKGTLIVENGEFKGQAGHGEFLTRRLNPEVLERPAL